MITLRQYQKEAISFFANRNGRALVSLCPGAGKTLVALMTMVRYPKIDTAIVVCPSSVKLQWALEVEKHLSKRVYVISGNYTDKSLSLLKGAFPEIIVVNYDVMSSWAKPLSLLGFKLLILDESHYVKNHDSKRSKAVEYLSNNMPYCMMLSGTPITASVLDLWNQLHIIDRFSFENYNRFMYRYCPPIRKRIRVHGGMRVINAPGKPTHVDELNGVVNKYFFVKPESEVYSQLPEMTKVSVPVLCEDLREYQSLFDIFKNSDASWDVLETQLQNARIALGLSKVNQTVLWLRDYFETNPNAKLVVFAIHRKVVEALYEAFGKDKSVVYYGGMSDVQKEEARRRFVTDGSIRLLIGNVGSVGTGVDGLNTVTNSCVFVEIPYTASLATQCMGRVRRANSTYNNYFSYYMIAKGTMDEKVIEILSIRQESTEMALNGRELSREELFSKLMED